MIEITSCAFLLAQNHRLNGWVCSRIHVRQKPGALVKVEDRKIKAALGLGRLGLVAFLWGVKSGQFEPENDRGRR